MKRAIQPKLKQNGDRPSRSGQRNGNGKQPAPLLLQDIQRTQPHSIEAEQGVLGSMLLSPIDVISECVDKITEEYLYVPAHQTIYTVMVELWRKNQAFDLVTFTQVLRDRNILESIGGVSFVTSLWTFVPTAANITYYLEIVREKYILRQIIATCTEGVRCAFEEQENVNALLDDIERKTLAIRPAQESREQSIKDDVMEAIDGIERLYERKGEVTGLTTGFHDFDRMTNGLQDQDMVIVAARPSMGKTALAMNIAEHVGVTLELPVLVFSLEMSRQQLTTRLVCSRARVNLQKVRDGFLGERDFPALTAAASKLAQSKIKIIDDSNLYIDALIARSRRAKAQTGVRLIVVDYLQLLHARGFKPSERQQEVAHISSALKNLAKSLKIPVIVISQLNRQPESRNGGKPRLSDLRESGSIEQDGDLIALLVRPEVYEDNEERRHELAGEAELVIAKQRNGPVGEVALTFLKEFTRFEDRARQAEPV